MKRSAPLLLTTLLASACAAASSSAPPPAPAPTPPAGSGLLARADDRLVEAQYRGALALYDEFLKTYPDDPATPRARATRALVERLLASQTEIERLRRELDLRRSDLVARQAEIDQLRADLERLRRIDLPQGPAPPR